MHPLWPWRTFYASYESDSEQFFWRSTVQRQNGNEIQKPSSLQEQIHLFPNATQTRLVCAQILNVMKIPRGEMPVQTPTAPPPRRYQYISTYYIWLYLIRSDAGECFNLFILVQIGLRSAYWACGSASFFRIKALSLTALIAPIASVYKTTADWKWTQPRHHSTLRVRHSLSLSLWRWHSSDCICKVVKLKSSVRQLYACAYFLDKFSDYRKKVEIIIIKV